MTQTHGRHRKTLLQRSLPPMTTCLTLALEPPMAIMLWHMWCCTL